MLTVFDKAEHTLIVEQKQACNVMSLKKLQEAARAVDKSNSYQTTPNDKKSIPGREQKERQCEMRSVESSSSGGQTKTLIDAGEEVATANAH